MDRTGQESSPAETIIPTEEIYRIGQESSPAETIILTEEIYRIGQESSPAETIIPTEDIYRTIKQGLGDAGGVMSRIRKSRVY